VLLPGDSCEPPRELASDSTTIGKGPGRQSHRLYEEYAPAAANLDEKSTRLPKEKVQPGSSRRPVGRGNQRMVPRAPAKWWERAACGPGVGFFLVGGSRTRRPQADRRESKLLGMAAERRKRVPQR